MVPPTLHTLSSLEAECLSAASVEISISDSLQIGQNVTNQKGRPMAAVTKSSLVQAPKSKESLQPQALGTTEVLSPVGSKDAPDLGLRNHRFQNVSFRFKKQSIYERKT
jgi:hypothetical protein